MKFTSILIAALSGVAIAVIPTLLHQLQRASHSLLGHVRTNVFAGTLDSRQYE
ncbi:uncharacterized protein BBA_00070 [Beauveria bassiana ARSEF 2860]|uniref:Uncharacterized protein n=1 Tax=Beauveria bassiana (strain ARSEF 2860) TaxID=655819 RepID=J4WL20_BEAB2|nr:uncharacterized protein BBA_00070 [Beauveria bassiana ARSEF 2860]EJP70440.1 hypothetical protein BBA_00070 [Beauveria bassiana ARSEF 2860]